MQPRERASEQESDIACAEQQAQGGVGTAVEICKRPLAEAAAPSGRVSRNATAEKDRSDAGAGKRSKPMRPRLRDDARREQRPRPDAGQECGNNETRACARHCQYTRGSDYGSCQALGARGRPNASTAPIRMHARDREDDPGHGKRERYMTCKHRPTPQPSLQLPSASRYRGNIFREKSLQPPSSFPQPHSTQPFYPIIVIAVTKPARRPVKGEHGSPRARARGSLDGPHRAPVTLAGRNRTALPKFAQACAPRSWQRAKSVMHATCKIRAQSFRNS